MSLPMMIEMSLKKWVGTGVPKACVRGYTPGKTDTVEIFHIPNLLPYPLQSFSDNVFRLNAAKSPGRHEGQPIPHRGNRPHNKASSACLN